MVNKLKVICNYYIPLLTSRFRSLPNFIIPGAQKCGTTSLYIHLKQHPDIRLSRSKEVWFFDREYQKGTPHYLANFPLAGFSKRAIGDVTPSYLDHPRAAERIKKLIPECRLIFILRDPIERAYSHYFHSRRLGVEPIESFEEAVRREPERLENVMKKLDEGLIDYSQEYTDWAYVSKGNYYKSLQKYFSLFDRNQILILWSQDYEAKPEYTLNKIAAHLNIRDWAWNTKGKANVGTNKMPNSSEFFEYLYNQYEEGDIKLSNLINEKVPWRTI